MLSISGREKQEKRYLLFYFLVNIRVESRITINSRELIGQFGSVLIVVVLFGLIFIGFILSRLILIEYVLIRNTFIRCRLIGCTLIGPHPESFVR